jgi:hypothetical protein
VTRFFIFFLDNNKMQSNDPRLPGNQKPKATPGKWDPGPNWRPCGCTGMGNSIGLRPCTPQEVRNGHILVGNKMRR